MEPYRILLADGDEQRVQLFTKFLAPCGYVLEPATDGIDALAKLRGESFDLVILGTWMPRMDGIEVLLALQREPLDPPVPVVMVVAVSALVDDNLRIQAWLRTLGASDFIETLRMDPRKIRGIVERLLPPRTAPAQPGDERSNRSEQ